MSEVRVIRLTPTQALATSGMWRPILQRAIDDAEGRWSWEQLVVDVSEGDIEVWCVAQDDELHGVFTTRIIDSDIRWLLVEDLAGDEIDGWLMAADAVLEEWARRQGVKQIVAEGRRGWGRKLKGLGYGVTRVQAVKRLGTETMQ